MARLLVEAVRNEPVLKVDSSGTGAMRFCLSVAESDTGRPVSRLVADHFRVMSTEKSNPPFKILVEERTWPGEEKPASGIYDLAIVGFGEGPEWDKGRNYAFGIQVRRFRGSAAIDFGQTVVSVMGVGQIVYSMPEGSI
ncbi:MAG TPA: hypothetical protein VI670_06135 [Thermoanaerobaculia bacterium]|jgi:hypothetical protein